MAEYEHHEADELDLAAEDFWVQIESSPGAGPIWDRSLNLSTRWIGKTNGILARCLWERTPGAPPTWTPHRILAPLFSSSSLVKYFACILLICAV